MDKTTQAKIEELKARIVPVLEKYPITKAGLFGSVVRGEDGPDSDVDILVEYETEPRLSLYDVIHIKHDIEDTINKKVDLVQYRMVKPHYREYILPNEVRIYEKG